MESDEVSSLSSMTVLVFYSASDDTIKEEARPVESDDSEIDG